MIVSGLHVDILPNLDKGDRVALLSQTSITGKTRTFVGSVKVFAGHNSNLLYSNKFLYQVFAGHNSSLWYSNKFLYQEFGGYLCSLLALHTLIDVEVQFMKHHFPVLTDGLPTLPEERAYRNDVLD